MADIRRRRGKPGMIVDMRLRPPLKSWVTKIQYHRGGGNPARLGFPRPLVGRSEIDAPASEGNG